MQVHLIYELNNRLLVVHGVPKEDLEKVLGSLTDEQYENFVIARSIPEGCAHRKVELSDLPESREFRDAWADLDDTSAVNISASKARDLALSRLRSDRGPKLAALDVKVIKAMESGDSEELATLVSQKNELRAITDSLKNFTLPSSDIANAPILDALSSMSKQLEN